jgi:homoserine/homoserine lactone efflux protein
MLTSIGLFALTELLFSASPGPAVAMVVGAAIGSGWRGANLAILGVLFGNLVYFGVSCLIILGAASVKEDLFIYIKIGGAAYLTWLLLDQYILSRFRLLRKAEADDQAVIFRKQFLRTFVMQLSNPKTILFFSAFLPQFVTLQQSVPLQLSVLAVVSFLVEYTVLGFYAWCALAARNRITSVSENGFEHLGNATMVVAVVWGLFFT